MSGTNLTQGGEEFFLISTPNVWSGGKREDRARVGGQWRYRRRHPFI